MPAMELAAGDDGPIDIGNVIHKPGDLFAILIGEAVTGRVGDIDYCCAGGDHGLDHAGEVFIVGAAGVFGVEFDVADEVTSPFHGLDSALQDFFAGSVEFAFDVRVRGTDAGMNAGLTGVAECFGCDFDIFLDGAAETADGGVFDDLSYFFDRMKITGAGDGEAGLDDIHSQSLQLNGQADFFFGIELTARNLFTVAEGGVENEDFFVGHSLNLQRFKKGGNKPFTESTFVYFRYKIIIEEVLHPLIGGKWPETRYCKGF